MTYLRCGADVNVRGSHSYSSSSPLTNLLLEIELTLSMTSLGVAFSINSLDMSRTLLHSGTDIVSSNVIFVVVRTSNDGLFKLLLDNGVNVDIRYSQNVYDWTPLHYVVIYDGVKMVDQLLSYEADVHLMNYSD